MENKERLISLKRFYKKNQRLPSYSEMLSIFNLKSKDSVANQINKFVKEGYLQKNDKKITPTYKFFSLPILGTIKAGIPHSTEQQNDLYPANELNFIFEPDRTFLLKVSGDSMLSAGIFDGDMVILDKNKEPKNGDIIAACIDNEWTLKYFYKNDNQVVLISGNSKYPPLYPKETLSSGGVVIKVIRNL